MYGCADQSYIGDMEMLAESIPTPKHKRSIDMSLIVNERDRLHQLRNLEKIRKTIFSNYESKILKVLTKILYRKYVRC